MGVLTLVGEQQISEGNLTDAKACFIRATESDPSNGSVLSNLALTHERESDPDAALNVRSCLSEIHATAATDHRRGEILLSLGCLAEGWPWCWFNEGDTSPRYSNVTLCRSDGKWAETMSPVASNFSQESP